MRAPRGFSEARKHAAYLSALARASEAVRREQDDQRLYWNLRFLPLLHEWQRR